MNIGGRRAKTPFTPPIPVPPPPPSAYGLSMPGAPAAPQQQAYQAPPPPLTTSSVPPPPAASDPSGFFGAPVAAAPPSQFGSFGQTAPVPPSPFGSYGQTTMSPPLGGFGQPAPHATPPVQPSAAGPRPKALVAAGVSGVVLLGMFLGPRLMDELHRHHTTTLPATVQQYAQLDPAAEAKISQAFGSAMPSTLKGKVTHVQAAIYQQGVTPGLLVTTADLPAGSQRHAKAAFKNDDGSDDFHDVVAPAGRFGGTVRCTVMTTGASSLEACGWVDDGTMGFVMSMSRSVDEPTLIALLGEVRAAVER